VNAVIQRAIADMLLELKSLIGEQGNRTDDPRSRANGLDDGTTDGSSEFCDHPE
jgi:hypothetical protein